MDRRRTIILSAVAGVLLVVAMYFWFIAGRSPAPAVSAEDEAVSASIRDSMIDPAEPRP